MRGLTGMLCTVAVAVALLVLVGTLHAAPRKVLILPLDGSVDPSVRAKLNASLEKAARGVGGAVTVGDTTFEETATAIGCNPSAPPCAEQVRKTLGYEVLVWGTVTTKDGRTVLVVKRVSAGAAARTDRIELDTSEPPERTDAKLQATLGGGSAPAHDRTHAGGDHRSHGTGGRAPGTVAPATSAAGPPTDGATEAALTGDPVPAPAYDNGTRNRGIVFAAGGGGMLLAGLVVWSAKSSTQDDIDRAPTQTAQDFQRLEDLEGRARNLALLGDVLVVGGLVAGGYGAWVLYQDRNERRVVVTPAVTPTSAAVTIGGRW